MDRLVSDYEPMRLMKVLINWNLIVRKAVEESIAYVRYALVTAVPKGEGWGPLNHQCYTVQRTIPL
jgi:hypothetical protein